MSYILKEIETIVKKHFHIDNGGHTIAVDKLGNVYFDTGFFGYSSTTLKLETHPREGFSTFMVTVLLRHLERAQSELVGLKEPADDPRPDELLTGDCGEVYKIVISKYGDVTLIEGDGDVILFLSGSGMSGSGQRFIPFLIEALTEAKGKLRDMSVGVPIAAFTTINGLGWLLQQGDRYGLIKSGKKRFYWAVSDTSDFAWEGRQWTETRTTDVQVAMRECLEALAQPKLVPVSRQSKLAEAQKKTPKVRSAGTLAFRQVGERGARSANPGWWQTEGWNGVYGLVRSYNPTARTPFYWGLSTDPQRDIDLDGYKFSEHVDWHRATSFEDARDACIRAVLGEPVYPLREPIQLAQFPTANPDPKRFPIPWSAHDRGQGEVHLLAADGTYVLRVDTTDNTTGKAVKLALLRINGPQYPYGPDGGKYPADWKV